MAQSKQRDRVALPDTREIYSPGTPESYFEKNNSLIFLAGNAL